MFIESTYWHILGVQENLSLPKYYKYSYTHRVWTRTICCLHPLVAVLSSGLCGKAGEFTSSERLNRSENYLLLGFLLIMPSQSVLLFARQSVTQDNCSILVSYPSSSKVKLLKFSDLQETEITHFKRVELCQETIQSRYEVMPLFVNYEMPWWPSKKCKQT